MLELGSPVILLALCYNILCLTSIQVLALNSRVKMSTEEKELGLFIVDHRDDDFGAEPFDHCQDLVLELHNNVHRRKRCLCELLKYLNLRSTLEKLVDWVPPRFPVRGEEVLLAGVPRGPTVGKVLLYLQQKWKDSRYQLNAEELLMFIEEAKQNC